MIHAFLRFSLKLVFWIYYRRVDFRGLENLPTNGPIILACNHPNSFLDALMVGTYTKQRIYFLARSDVFNTPLKRWILNQTSLLPVYRLQEGMENLDKNKTTFSKCFEILDNHKNPMILIFSEGICVQELRLRPLKKGTARIALEYVKDGKHLSIVPVGLNYLKPRTSREEVMVDIGKPFDAADFSASYNSNAGKAINEFNKELESRLRLSVIDIKDRANESALTQALQVVQNDGKDLKSLIKIASDFDKLHSAVPEGYKKLVDTAREYNSRLNAVGLDDRMIKDNKSSSILPGLLFPLYWLGRLLNGLPYVTAKWLAQTKVKKMEFYDSVFLGALMFVNQFHSLFIALLMLVFHPFLSILIPGILLLTGGITTSLHDFVMTNRLRRRREKLPIAEREELKILRQRIVDQLER